MITRRSFKERFIPISHFDQKNNYEVELNLRYDKKDYPLLRVTKTCFPNDNIKSTSQIKLQVYFFNIIYFLSKGPSDWVTPAKNVIMSFVNRYNISPPLAPFYYRTTPSVLSYFNRLTFIYGDYTTNQRHLYLATNMSYIQFPFSRDAKLFPGSKSLLNDLINSKYLEDYYLNNEDVLFPSHEYMVTQFKNLSFSERFTFLERLKVQQPFLYYVFIGFLSKFPHLLHPFPYFPATYTQDFILSSSLPVFTFDVGTFAKLFPDTAYLLLTHNLSYVIDDIRYYSLFDNVKMYIDNLYSIDSPHNLLLLK